MTASMSGPRTVATTAVEHEMGRVISEISSSWARTDPSACINTLNPLIDTPEGRRFLSKQGGEKALVLIELFDWALKSHRIRLNKACILWTLRQLCACNETLPESYVLPIEFKSNGPYHAAGGFADVWRGRYKEREVAFKSIRGGTLSDDAAHLKRKRRFCKEVVLWKSLNHPNILGLIGVCQWENAPDARLTMVSEWMTNGNITEYIKHNDSQRMRLLVDCAMGVQYLHDIKLVHGDLKGANILITAHDPVRACLADFGFMTIVYDEADGPDGTSALCGGTMHFMAPELLSPNKFGKAKCQVSKEADVYAFGMVILQVLSGLMPFHNVRDTEVVYKVIQGDRPLIPDNAGEIGISEGLWQLLAKCWNSNCTGRPQINEILQQLSQEPALGLIFPPSNLPRTPSSESVFVSATQKYADMFVTANTYTPTEESPPFPMPVSPADTSEYSSNEIRNPASIFSAETQDVSPFTSPGHTQIGAEEPKPPVSKTSSGMISDRSGSVDVAGSADDPAAFKGARERARVSSPLSQDLGPLQHDPIIDGTPHVDLTPVPAQEVSRSPSPRPDPSGKKPTLPKIQTSAQTESRNSDIVDTAFYTPNGGDEVVNRRPFDSAMNIQVVYSGSSSHSRNVTDGPGRGVVEVRQPGDKWRSQYHFPTQSLRIPQSDSKTTEDTPRQELRMSSAESSQVTRERGGDSTFSFSSSPLNEFQEDAGPSKRSLEANTSTIPGLESGSHPKSKLSAGDEGNDIQDSKITFPQQKTERMVPRREDGEGRSGADRREKGKEREDHSRMSPSVDYVSVSNRVEEHPQGQDLTPRPSRNPFERILAKIGRKPSQHFRPSPPPKRATPLTQSNNTTAPSMTTATTATGSVDILTTDSGEDHKRTPSGPPRSHLTRTRKNGNQREVKPSIKGFFEDPFRSFR